MSEYGVTIMGPIDDSPCGRLGTIGIANSPAYSHTMEPKLILDNQTENQDLSESAN